MKPIPVPFALHLATIEMRSAAMAADIALDAGPEIIKLETGDLCITNRHGRPVSVCFPSRGKGHY